MVSPVSVFAAAKRLGEKSNWSLTHLQMQKMLYIAHVYYLGVRNEPLVDGSFEAWDYGPVHPKLYHYLKRYGADVIPESTFAAIESVPENHPGIPYLDAGVEQLPRARLIAITHWEKGAWYASYRPGEMGIPIPDAAIIKEYNNRMDAASK